MAQKRYFRLRDDVGVEGPVLVDGIDPNTGAPNEKENPRAGELQPLENVGVRVKVPVNVKSKQIIEEVRHVEITPDGLYHGVDSTQGFKRVGLPNTDDRVLDAKSRTLALTSPSVIHGVLWSGNFEEIETPKSEQTRKPKES